MSDHNRRDFLKAGVGIAIGAVLPIEAVESIAAGASAPALALELSSPLAPIVAPKAFSPADIPGLRIWIEATSDGAGFVDMLTGRNLAACLGDGSANAGGRSPIVIAYDRVLETEERSRVDEWLAATANLTGV